MKKSYILIIFFIFSFMLSGGESEPDSEEDRGAAHFEFTYTTIRRDPINTVQIYPSPEIIEIFDENDVAPEYLKESTLPGSIPDVVKADIEKVISENIDDVITLIKEELKASLLAEEVDYSYMIIGDRLFAMNLYFK